MTAVAKPRNAHNPYTEAEITEGLMAVIAWAGNCAAAERALKAEGKLDVAGGTLQRWIKGPHADRYAEMREKYADQLEARLVQEYRDNTGLALSVQRLALEKAQERLESGKDQDPARTAANAATVADKNVRNMLSLSGRPTQIREDRNLDQVLRSLMAKGVLALPEGEVVDAE